MQNNISNREKIWNILKLIWAVLIIYFWLKLFVYDSWEKLNFDKDYLDDGLESDEIHNSSSFDSVWYFSNSENLDSDDIYKKKYELLCAENNIVCDKFVYDWDFLYKDKFVYLASTIYTINMIADDIQIWWNIYNQLHKITMRDVQWANRWSANWNNITFNMWSVKSYVEFVGLIAHELGHIVDLWVINWASAKKSIQYTEFDKSVFSIDDPSLDYYKLSWQSETVRNDDSVKEDFCSWYWMTDPFEDFAECHNLYLTHNAIFREWAKKNLVMRKKYNFFANLYDWQYLFYSSSDLTKFSPDGSWRPWDTTKMY